MISHPLYLDEINARKAPLLQAILDLFDTRLVQIRQRTHPEQTPTKRQLNIVRTGSRGQAEQDSERGEKSGRLARSEHAVVGASSTHLEFGDAKEH